MRASFLFTSESVSEGHPDKVSDQISDTIVDLFLAKDPEARIACETLCTTQLVVLAGEIRGKGIMDADGNWAPGVEAEIEAAVRQTVRDIGYEQDGFHWESFRFENNLHGQSAHIAQGVDASGNKDEGAGDQGIMFGYASDETPDLMPATLDYSHKILERLAADRHAGTAFLLPDAKSQVTLRYENEVPVEATAIVVSTQHAAGYYHHNGEGDEALYGALRDHVKAAIAAVMPAHLLTDTTVYHINPTGRFEIGGPDGDAGLTGRKIIVDTYGGASPHGGGAFSGKDPTKVDRSAAYITRYLAKNVVAAGLARRCTIQIAYAIGVAEPLSLYVDLHGTGTVEASALEAVLPTLVSLTPRGIRTHLGLNKPIYRTTAAYGHFGRKAEGDRFPWERTDLVEALKAALA